MVEQIRIWTCSEEIDQAYRVPFHTSHKGLFPWPQDTFALWSLSHDAWPMRTSNHRHCFRTLSGGPFLRVLSMICLQHSFLPAWFQDWLRIFFFVSNLSATLGNMIQEYSGHVSNTTWKRPLQFWILVRYGLCINGGSLRQSAGRRWGALRGARKSGRGSSGPSSSFSFDEMTWYVAYVQKTSWSRCLLEGLGMNSRHPKE